MLVAADSSAQNPAPELELGLGRQIELVDRIGLPSSTEATRYTQLAREGPLLAAMVETAVYADSLDFYRRGEHGDADWQPDGSLPVPRTDSLNITWLGERLAYHVMTFPAGPAIQLASRAETGWYVSGMLRADQPGDFFGRLVTGNATRLVSVAGTLGQNADLLTWVRNPGTSAGWTLTQRIPIDGALSLVDLVMADDTLAVLVSVAGGTRVELFDWEAGPGWVLDHTIEPGSWNDLDLRADHLAIASMWGSHDGSPGLVELWERSEGNWGPDTTIVAPIETDGYQGRIGYRVHFLESGDLIAQAFPPGCTGDPTCEPGPPGGSRLYQFDSRREWALAGWWRDDPTAPEGQVGQELVSSGNYVIANALGGPEPSLRVFSTVGQSALEIPTAGPYGLVGLAALLAVAALIVLSLRR